MKGRTFDGSPLVAGVNVDPVNIDAGLHLMRSFGYSDPHNVMVITYALQCWKRGEEDLADRVAIGQGHYDKTGCVSFTTWRAIVAAAVAASGTEVAND